LYEPFRQFPVFLRIDVQKEILNRVRKSDLHHGSTHG
jgi:hypothetical protein